jgi:hypothetical protein
MKTMPDMGRRVGTVPPPSSNLECRPANADELCPRVSPTENGRNRRGSEGGGPMNPRMMTTDTNTGASIACAGSWPLPLGHPEPGNQSAIVRVETKVGSVLPTFSAPPIDEVVVSNLNDADLIFATKKACSIHTQSGVYAREFLAELKRRFDEGKKLGKPYLGHKNFDKLCCDKVDITSRQVRNIMNNNPSGRKGRVLKPRPSIKELEDVKAENKRLKAHATLIEDANDRATRDSSQPAGDYTKQDLEQAKKDAARDVQAIAAKEKQENKNEIAALKETVRKLTDDNRELQEQPKKSASKPGDMSCKPSLENSCSAVVGSESLSREEAARQIIRFGLLISKRFSRIDKRWITDQAVAGLRDELAREAARGSSVVAA